MNIAAADIINSAISWSIDTRSHLTAPMVDFLHAHPALDLMITIIVPSIMVAGVIAIVVAATYERTHDTTEYPRYTWESNPSSLFLQNTNPWVDNPWEVKNTPAHADSYDEWALPAPR